MPKYTEVHTQAMDALLARTPIPTSSIFSAKHYEFLAALAAQTLADYGDRNMGAWLCQAFCQTQANFKPVLFSKRVAALAAERKARQS